MPCRKATWPPCGALGLPQVKALPLPETPAPPTKDHGEPAGSYWYEEAPEPSDGVSKPPSCTGGGGAALMVAWSMKAVLSPPLGLRPTNATVWMPAATAKL